jgi:hypothetical protein
LRYRINKKVYVDKTLELKSIFSNGYMIDILCRPKRSGKSTFLSMIECFISNDKETLNVRKDAFDETLIKNDIPFFKDNFGSYPVLYISMRVSYDY